MKNTFNDFTGNTQSAIQRIGNLIAMKNHFFETLQQLNENYDIKCNIFTIGVGGEPYEPTAGYYGELKQYESLEEAAKEFDCTHQAIYITDGEIHVGNVYKNLADVKEKFIIDLNNSCVL